MNNNKQSSVEWLQWALEHTILTHEQTMQTIGLFQQAKEMHKEEITQAWKKGDGQFDMVAEEMSSNYYNEIYGGNK